MISLPCATHEVLKYLYRRECGRDGRGGYGANYYTMNNDLQIINRLRFIMNPVYSIARTW